MGVIELYLSLLLPVNISGLHGGRFKKLYDFVCLL